MIEIISYPFMQKAIITGIVISIACSILGVFLILRRYSMIGDGLAHISFGGIALGLFFKINPYFTALLFAIVSAIGILKLKDKAKIYGDTAIGIISQTGLGIGITLASISNGFNVDLLSYLFGNILAISQFEVITSIILAICVISIIILFYNDLTYITFDEDSAKTSGINVNMYNIILVTLTAITVVSSIKVIGLLLCSTLLILPASSALQISNSFRKTLIYSVIFSITSVVAGILIAYYYDIAVSGSIVIINLIIFGLMFLIKKKN